MKKVLCVLAAGALAAALLAGCGASAVEAGQDAVQTQYYPYNGVTSRNLENPDDYNYAGPLDYSDLYNLDLLSRIKQYNQLECMVRRFDTISYTTQWNVVMPQMMPQSYNMLHTDLTLHKGDNGYWESNNETTATKIFYDTDDAGNLTENQRYNIGYRDYMRQTDDRYILDLSLRPSSLYLIGFGNMTGRDMSEGTLDEYPADQIRLLHPYHDDDTATVFNVALNRDIGNSSIATWVDQGIVTVENAYMDGGMAVIQICYVPGDPDYRIDETYYVDTSNDVIRHFVKTETQISTNILVYKYETAQDVNVDFDEKTEEFDAAIHAKDGKLVQTSWEIDDEKFNILFSLGKNIDYVDGWSVGWYDVTKVLDVGQVYDQISVLQ